MTALFGHAHVHWTVCQTVVSSCSRLKGVHEIKTSFVFLLIKRQKSNATKPCSYQVKVVIMLYEYTLVAVPLASLVETMGPLLGYNIVAVMLQLTIVLNLHTSHAAILPFQALDLSLNLISGLTGAKLGHPVPFNLTGQGKLIGPLLHETQEGAYYILFGLGKKKTTHFVDLSSRFCVQVILMCNREKYESCLSRVTCLYFNVFPIRKRRGHLFERCLLRRHREKASKSGAPEERSRLGETQENKLVPFHTYLQVHLSGRYLLHSN